MALAESANRPSSTQGPALVANSHPTNAGLMPVSNHTTPLDRHRAGLAGADGSPSD